jgi:hypothetical protein
MPWHLMHYAAIEGLELPWRTDELERLVVGWSTVHRSGRAGLVLPIRPEVPRTVWLRADEGHLRACDRADAHLRATYGPSAAGGYLGVIPAARPIPVGPAFAPTAARWMQGAAAAFDLHIGDLEPSRGFHELDPPR